MSVRVLRSGLRWAFGIEAFVFLFGSMQVAWVLSKAAQSPAGAHMRYFGIGLTYLFLTGVAAAFAAWRMAHPDRFARTAGLLASLMNLPVVPFGTVIGAAGLFVFLRKQSQVPVGVPAHTPIAGDGTTKWSRPLLFLVQILWVWFAYGWMRDRAIERGLHPHSLGMAGLLVVVLSIYISTLVHELGHFVAGRAVGFRMFGFRLGPLEWVYRSGRWRLRRHRDILGGHVAMVPASADRIRQRAMVLTLGGPLGSAFLALAGWVLLSLVAGSPSMESAGDLLVLLTAFGSGDFLANLFPSASGLHYSDGARLWQLYGNGPWADYLCSTYYAGLSQTTPLRPRDWPRPMVEHAAAFGASLPSAAGSLVLAYVHFEDCGEVEMAAYYLEQACANDRGGGELAKAITQTRAYFEAVHRRNPSEAARWFSLVPEQPDSADYWLSKAALFASQGHVDAAEEAWRTGWDLASKLPETGLYEMDRRQFRDVAAWLNEITAQPATEVLATIC